MTERDRIARTALLLLLVLAAIALPWAAPVYYVQLAAKMLLLGIAAMSLSLLVGASGLVSMCHAAFYGLAGYVLALLAPLDDPPALWLTLAGALAIAGLAGFVIGVLALRTRGVYFIMVTLAFGEMLFYLFHDTSIAGGSDGVFIYQKPQPRIFGLLLFDLDRADVFYWMCLTLAIATLLLLQALLRAPFGRALEAARVNERRARALGFPVDRARLFAFVISAMLSALAGYFAAAQFGFVAPQMLGWHASALLLVVVVLGGLRGVGGPLAGAIVFTGLEEILKAATDHWRLALGLAVIAMVLALPGGLRGLIGCVTPSGKGPAGHG